MRKWQLTLGLGALAMLAVLVAPRLLGSVSAADGVLGQPQVVPVAPTVAPDTGPLLLRGGLDHTALSGHLEERFLVFEISAPEARATHRPLDLAIVIDGSGSMSAAGKMNHARDAARQLARTLGPQDTLGLFVFNDTARVVRPVSPLSTPESVDHLVEKVYEGGGTNLHAGLELGGRELLRVTGPSREAQLVLLSDGKASVGITNPSVTATLAAELAVKGVSISTVGLGLDYDEDALASIADLGGGTYRFVDDSKALPEVLETEIGRARRVIARDTRVTIALADGVELLDVVGWQTTAAGAHRHALWLGDLSTGDTRRVVARVRTPVTSSMAQVATATLDYIHDGGIGTSTLGVTVPVVSDEDSAAAAHPHWAPIAQRAWAGAYVEDSTRAYESGDLTESQELLRKGQAVLTEAAHALATPALLHEAAELDRTLRAFQQSKPSSPAGRRAIKSTKETLRGSVR